MLFLILTHVDTRHQRFIIEQVFYLPGLGRLIFESISGRDLIVVESVIMLIVFAVIVINFAVDLAYALIDPRLRART